MAHFIIGASSRPAAVATSSTHAEAQAIFTLAKELNFIIAFCQELQIPLELPAIIMEDNSAVVTMSNNDSGYANTFSWCSTTSRNR